MEITLPEEALKSLPSPDGEGLVRVTVALKMGDGGKANIVEVNDVPVGSDDEKETDMPEESDMPSPDDIASSIMKPAQ